MSSGGSDFRYRNWACPVCGKVLRTMPQPNDWHDGRWVPFVDPDERRLTAVDSSKRRRRPAAS